MKKPISWTTEEFIFGSCGLRDEIKRRKKAGENHGIFNETAIRIWMVIGFTAGIFLCLTGHFGQQAANLIEKLRGITKENDSN